MAEVELARRLSGLTLEAAAREARISTSYLRRIEAGSGAPFGLAQRLAYIYKTPIDIFLKSKTTRGTKEGEQTRSDGTGTAAASAVPRTDNLKKSAAKQSYAETMRQP